MRVPLFLCGPAWKTEGKGGLFLFPFPFFYSEGHALKINGPDSGKEKKKKKSGIRIISQMETGRVKP